MNAQPAISWQDRDAAGFMSLEVSAGSDGACGLVEEIMRDVVVPAWPADTQKRPKALAKHRLAVAVIFGELQRQTLRQSVVGKHGMSPKDFVAAPFGLDVFKRTVEALQRAGLLDVLGGWRWTSPGFVDGGPSVQTGSTVTTFGLIITACDLLRRHGLMALTLKEWRSNWRRPETINVDAVSQARKANVGPPALVELRAAKGRAGAVLTSGERMVVDLQDPCVRRIAAELEAHNAFVAGVGVEGAVFSGLKRVFNNGNVDGFAWQWGGRFTSRLPGGYDSERKVDRLDAMTIAGKPVVEIDIRAAHLTILYALEGLPFDPAARDPYAVGGMDRELVKKIVVQTIGRGDLKAPRWSKEAVAQYGRTAPGRDLQTDLAFKPARAAVVEAHPILRRLQNPGRTVHDLNFYEAEIVSTAMRELRSLGIASLPVHDCLIVPEVHEEAAKGQLERAFTTNLAVVSERSTGIKPALSVHRGPRSIPEGNV